MVETLEFLEQLRRNNNREWFHEHKGWYDELRERFLTKGEALIRCLSSIDEEVAGTDVKACVYRIYRDIRFSSDKTPYKTYFSMFVARGGRKSPRGGYYLHIEPGNCLLSGGIWCPDPPLLKALRQAVYENYDEFLSIVEDPDFRALYPNLDGEVLKTVPRPFPRDCEQAEYLKRKDYVVTASVPDSFFRSTDWVEQAALKLGKIYPLNRFLNFTVDEFMGI